MQKRITTCLILILMLYSCNDLFHEDDLGYLELDTEKERLEMLNAIYYHIINVHDEKYLAALCRSDDINLYKNYQFDGCGSSGGSQEYSIPTAIDNIYHKLYNAIITANNIIIKTNESDFPELMGEVYFLRAYCYFKLARFYGRPPLVSDIHVNYNLPKPSYTDVYEFVEFDLLKAIELLPENAEQTRIPNETPNKYTCKALLAELYLSWAGYPVNDESKYNEVIKFASEIIVNPKYHLINNLRDIYRVSNIHNSENLFSLYNYQKNSSINSIYNFGYSTYIANKFTQTHVTESFYEFNGETMYTYTSIYSPDFYYYMNYPNNYRKEVFFNTGEYRDFEITMDGETLNISGYYRYDPISNPCAYIDNAECVKGIDLMNLKESSLSKEIPMLNILRYTQTLLTYIEAKARINELDKNVIDAFNMIRRRANGLDINKPSAFDLDLNITTTQFIDSVVLERSYELCYEPEGRWFDIIRLDLKEEILQNHVQGDKSNQGDKKHLSNDWYFYLIPQEDRWLNPNFEKHEK